MKIQTNTLAVERSGLQTESRFTIKATAKAFDILSSSLYSDKPLAVVRELACNAYDSHVAAGKKDVPFEIRLPTTLDPMFHVRDFGLGLSDFEIRGSWKHEDGTQLSVEDGSELGLINDVDGWTYVSGIYTTFFDSLKTHSNDFIGQLGLGSKSPFSYATTFIVESIHNGVKRVYTCFKDEQNMPAVARLDESPTDECNGVMVAIAVRPTDVDKFHTAAKKALMYFSPAPTIIGRTGFAPYMLKHTVTGSKWRIRDTEFYAQMSGAHVVQGFVAYPVDTHILTEAGLSGNALALAGVDVDLYVDIGNVETAASREALSYVPHTIKNLISAFDQAAQEMRTSFQAEFDKCTTRWEVAMLIAKLEGGVESSKLGKIFKNMHQADPFTWRGEPATGTLTLNLSSVTNTQIRHVSVVTSRKIARLVTNGSWQPTQDADVFELEVRKTTLVVVDTIARGGEAAIKQLLTGKGDGKASVILIRPVKGRGAYDQAEINSVIEALGMPPVIDMVTIAVSKAGRTRSQYSGFKRDAEERLVFTGFKERANCSYYDTDKLRRTFSRLTWEAEQIDLAAGGFYIELHRFEPVHGNQVDRTHLDDILRDAKKLGLIEEDDVIVGMNEKELARAQKVGNWVNLFTHIRSQFAEANADGALLNAVSSHAVFGLIGVGVRERLIKDWDALSTTVVDGEFKDLVNATHVLYQDAKYCNPATIINLMLHMNIQLKTDVRVNSLVASWNALGKRYEMLSLVTMTESNGHWVKPVINYVNKIDMS